MPLSHSPYFDYLALPLLIFCLRICDMTLDTLRIIFMTKGLKRLAPIIEEISTEYAGHIKVTKLDVDQNPDVPLRYQVMGIPTVLVFKGGELVDSIVGFIPKDKLLSRLLPHIGPF